MSPRFGTFTPTGSQAVPLPPPLFPRIIITLVHHDFAEHSRSALSTDVLWDRLFQVGCQGRKRTKQIRMVINYRTKQTRVLAILVASISGLSFLCAGQGKQLQRAQPAPVTAETDWEFYLGSPGNTHYSTLTQINVNNVSQLREVWSFDTKEKGGLETTPLMIDGVLYAYTPKQEVIALDAATGAVRWMFDSQREFAAEKVASRAERGLAYWHDGDEKRIFAGISKYVYALDPATGKVIRSFADDGRIDLREDLRGDPKLQSVSITSPGVVYKDLLIVGDATPEALPAPPGDIRAYDARTGKLRWTFHTIPHPGEVGYDTWPKNAWKYSGSANNWTGFALDPERGIVYAPTGSAATDWYGGDRIGDDLFANTLIALDAETGKRIWHFQAVRHDLWDRDLPSPPTLVTVVRNGKETPAVALTSKQGFLFLFNRATGEPLFPIEYRSVAASAVPGEVAAVEQPFPVKPAPFARQKITETDLTNRTPEAHEWAVKQFRKFHYEGQFTPNSAGVDTLMFPGYDGGAEYGGSAFDPETHVLYINANDVGLTESLVKHMAGSAGRAIYLSQCGSCHRANRAGSPPETPSLINIGTRMNATQIGSILQSGKGRMLPFPNLDPASGQARALIQYLLRDESKKADRAAPGSQSVQPDTGRGVYVVQCSSCHRENRAGSPPAIPSLLNIRKRMSAAQIGNILKAGKGQMPPFPYLDPASGQTRALIRYLLRGEPTKIDRTATAMQPGPYDTTGYDKFLDPEGYPATAPPWGTLNAINLDTGEYEWKETFGQYPELVAKGLPDTGSENYGGPVVTAGGVLFIGATVLDKKFRAYDKATGKLLWETQLPFSAIATPITYEIDGRQYVVIAAGGLRDPSTPGGGGVYVAFALPQ
jgi:glucose dehydrogenase